MNPHDKVKALRQQANKHHQIKQEFDRYIRDEQAAVERYARTISEAEAEGCREIVSELRGIRSQEEQHKNIFKRLITQCENKEKDLLRQADDEQRRLDDELRHKRTTREFQFVSRVNRYGQ
jgi:rubrerythrin